MSRSETASDVREVLENPQLGESKESEPHQSSGKYSDFQKDGRSASEESGADGEPSSHLTGGKQRSSLDEGRPPQSNSQYGQYRHHQTDQGRGQAVSHGEYREMSGFDQNAYNQMLFYQHQQQQMYFAAQQGYFPPNAIFYAPYLPQQYMMHPQMMLQHYPIPYPPQVMMPGPGGMPHPIPPPPPPPPSGGSSGVAVPGMPPLHMRTNSAGAGGSGGTGVALVFPAYHTNPSTPTFHLQQPPPPPPPSSPRPPTATPLLEPRMDEADKQVTEDTLVPEAGDGAGGKEEVVAKDRQVEESAPSPSSVPQHSVESKSVPLPSGKDEGSKEVAVDDAAAAEGHETVGVKIEVQEEGSPSMATVTLQVQVTPLKQRITNSSPPPSPSPAQATAASLTTMPSRRSWANIAANSNPAHSPQPPQPQPSPFSAPSPSTPAPKPMTRTARSSTSLTRAPISLPRVSDTQVPLISRENSSTSSLSAPSLNQSSGAHTPSTPAPAAMASSATGGSAQAAGSSSSGGSRPRGKLESLISYPPATTAQVRESSTSGSKRAPLLARDSSSGALTSPQGPDHGSSSTPTPTPTPGSRQAHGADDLATSPVPRTASGQGGTGGGGGGSVKSHTSASGRPSPSPRPPASSQGQSGSHASLIDHLNLTMDAGAAALKAATNLSPPASSEQGSVDGRKYGGRRQSKASSPHDGNQSPSPDTAPRLSAAQLAAHDTLEAQKRSQLGHGSGSDGRSRVQAPPGAIKQRPPSSPSASSTKPPLAGGGETGGGSGGRVKSEGGWKVSGGGGKGVDGSSPRVGAPPPLTPSSPSLSSQGKSQGIKNPPAAAPAAAQPSEDDGWTTVETNTRKRGTQPSQPTGTSSGAAGGAGGGGGGGGGRRATDPPSGSGGCAASNDKKGRGSKPSTPKAATTPSSAAASSSSSSSAPFQRSEPTTAGGLSNPSLSAKKSGDSSGGGARADPNLQGGGGAKESIPGLPYVKESIPGLPYVKPVQTGPPQSLEIPRVTQGAQEIPRLLPEQQAAWLEEPLSKASAVSPLITPSPTAPSASPAPTPSATRTSAAVAQSSPTLGSSYAAAAASRSALPSPSPSPSAPKPPKAASQASVFAPAASEGRLSPAGLKDKDKDRMKEDSGLIDSPGFSPMTSRYLSSHETHPHIHPEPNDQLQGIDESSSSPPMASYVKAAQVASSTRPISVVTPGEEALEEKGSFASAQESLSPDAVLSSSVRGSLTLLDKEKEKVAKQTNDDDEDQDQEEEEEEGGGASHGNPFSALADGSEIPFQAKGSSKKQAQSAAIALCQGLQLTPEAALESLCLGKLNEVLLPPRAPTPSSSASTSSSAPSHQAGQADSLVNAAWGKAPWAAFRLTPRGFVNTGNSCFINSTLQALLSCGGFCSIMYRLRTASCLVDRQKYPLLHGLSILAAELASADVKKEAPAVVGAVGTRSGGDSSSTSHQPSKLKGGLEQALGSEEQELQEAEKVSKSQKLGEGEGEEVLSKADAVGSSPEPLSAPSEPSPSPSLRMEPDWSTVVGSKSKKGGGKTISGSSSRETQHAAAASSSPAAAAASSSAQGSQGGKAQGGKAQGGKAQKVTGSAQAAMGGNSSKPLVLSMLHEAVRKFSPRFSASTTTAEEGGSQQPQASGSGSGLGPVPSMAHRLRKGQGLSQHGGHSQEQEDADEFFHFLVDASNEELIQLRLEKFQPAPQNPPTNPDSSLDLSSTSSQDPSSASQASTATASAGSSSSANNDNGWMNVSGKGGKRSAVQTRHVGPDILPLPSSLISPLASSSSSSSQGASSSTASSGAPPAPLPVLNQPNQPSPLFSIFSGSVKSVVKAPGSKPSATIQNFIALNLQLTGSDVNSLDAALRHHFAHESVEYKAEGSTTSCMATKSTYLHQLPEVLVVHLMRFEHLKGIASKIGKAISFPAHLKLHRGMVGEESPDLLLPPLKQGGAARKVEHVEYKLAATVSHHGRNLAGGHFTADALQPDGNWLRFNDAVVDLVSQETVLSEKPYLLFYQRIHQ